MLILAQARPTLPHTAKPSSPLPSSFPNQVIFQSPNSFFLENIAVRATSELLLTSVASPTLFALDPNTTNGTLTSFHTFPNATSLTGITEYQPGFFAVAASMINTTTRRAIPGTSVIWSVSVNARSPIVRALCTLSGNASANGLTSIPGVPDIILSADSNAGAVWQINARMGSAHLVIQDATMLPNAPPPALGINGLHVRVADATLYLYFSNSAQGTFSRVALRMQSGNVVPAGTVEALGSIQPSGQQQAPDDFALDVEGRAWVAVHPSALAVLSPPANGSGNWTQLTAIGNAGGTDAGLMQPTSAAFGRGSQAQTLYVTTGVGQVVAVDTRG
ncbi:hypothetical protein B0H19DRAFT_936171 [Mycena capillaripes]|nr:hypothetical protein B0H19DRAFT_936171 [Mycena capillaripes]